MNQERPVGLLALLAIAFGSFAPHLQRQGKRKDGWSMALLPFPLLFIALGAV